MLTGGQAMSYDDFPALTARQQEVLEFIVEKIKSEGYPHSIREINYQIGRASCRERV